MSAFVITKIGKVTSAGPIDTQIRELRQDDGNAHQQLNKAILVRFEDVGKQESDRQETHDDTCVGETGSQYGLALYKAH